ncbi:hypothetical protein BGZ81_006870 [Podila clonocystis]|nr:hypothetical protein BGZ81_006870 [Podila clonocystis]
MYTFLEKIIDVLCLLLLGAQQIVRSLKEHEEITLIGMEAAIPDLISLVLRAGKLGIGYQEIRTFTTQDGLGGNKSCIQFRMLRDQGYIALEKRPSALF